MISPPPAVDEDGRLKQYFHKLIKYYFPALSLFGQNVVESRTDPPTFDSYRARLHQLNSDVSGIPSQEALDQSLGMLKDIIREYGSSVNRTLSNLEQELAKTLELLAEVAEIFHEQPGKYDSDLRTAAMKLENTVRSKDLAQMRSALVLQVQELQACIQLMRPQPAAGLNPLELGVIALGKRLLEAERLASTDPLTELFNRRELKKHVRKRIEKRQTFSVIFIDLDRFKLINDRHGHQCGDRVLQFVATKLKQSVRASDVVCRWGGDEFVVILDCGFYGALERVQSLEERVRGQYLISTDGQNQSIDVCASLGFACYSDGDTLESLLHRADTNMFERKKELN
jgi:diguanylate cyclase (GGDEF)-like protein